ncbi:Uncharacterised protein [Providencia alcalifaciens]|nr:Uncharacterised protein [Providencia alcalifaciens]
MRDQEIAEILKGVKTIALVGASDRTDRPSYEVMEYLLHQGYQVIPVSPKLAGQILLGQQVYAQLKDIPCLLIWLMFLETQKLLSVLLMKQ